MTIYHIQYQPDGGEICVWDNSAEPIMHDGLQLLSVERDAPPDPSIERIEASCIVLKTDAQRRADRLPSADEVASAIVVELSGSDWIFLPMPPDRPALLNIETTRELWRPYRQALRDLSKPQDEQARRLSPAEMVDAWPLRPDGSDAIPGLRTRI